MSTLAFTEVYFWIDLNLSLRFGVERGCGRFSVHNIKSVNLGPAGLGCGVCGLSIMSAVLFGLVLCSNLLGAQRFFLQKYRVQKPLPQRIYGPHVPQLGSRGWEAWSLRTPTWARPKHAWWHCAYRANFTLAGLTSRLVHGAWISLCDYLHYESNQIVLFEGAVGRSGIVVLGSSDKIWFWPQAVRDVASRWEGLERRVMRFQRWHTWAITHNLLLARLSGNRTVGTYLEICGPRTWWNWRSAVHHSCSGGQILFSSVTI